MKIDEDKREIVMRAFEMFMKYGIRSVTMDDLARELRVSKKTLYKHFSDKDELVAACMEFHNMHEKKAIEEAICQPNQNAIDENFELSKVIIQQLQHIHPSVLYDLEKYYPEALGEFENYKQTQVAEWVASNMKKGIEEGLYRDDLNIPILTALYLKRMNDFFSIDAFPEGTTMETVYKEIFRYHIRGLASEKGIAYLKEKMKQELN